MTDDDVCNLDDIWPKFRGFALQECLSLSPDKYEDDGSSSSVILNILKQGNSTIYQDLGFSQDIHKNLDELIHKIEGSVLPKLLDIYETYKTHSVVDSMTSCTINLKRLPQSSSKQSSAKKATAQNVKKEEKDEIGDPSSPTDETSDPSSPRREIDLGRGKRKKFVKVKFDFDDEISPRTSMTPASTPKQRAKEQKSPKSQGRVSKVKNEYRTSTPGKQPTVLESHKKRKASSDLTPFSNKRVKVKQKSPVIIKEKSLGKVKEKPPSKLKEKPFQLKGKSQAKHTKSDVEESDNGIDGSLTRKELVEKDKEGVDTTSVATSQGDDEDCAEETKLLPDKLPFAISGEKQKNDTGVDVNTSEDVTDNSEAQIDSSHKNDCVDGHETAIEKEVDSDSKLKAEQSDLALVEAEKDITDNDAEGEGKENDPKMSQDESDNEPDEEEAILLAEMKAEEVSESPASMKHRRGRGPQKVPRLFPWNLVPIVCSICKTRYSTYSTLRRHWTKQHTTDGKFDHSNPPNLLRCEICEEEFNSPRIYLSHYRVHATELNLSTTEMPEPSTKFVASGERTDFDCDKRAPVTCSICKEKMVGEGSIYSHWKTKHRKDSWEKPPPLFYCDQCEQSFDAPRRFRIHYRMHTGAKPHTCDTCQKTFRTYNDLSAHIQSHDKTKSFVCTICSKGFNAQKILNRHMKGHLFPCVCDVCGKTYPTKYSLKLHSKIHTGEKPHKCDFCGVSFIQAGSLKLHRRLHLGEKPHVCETCGLRFNSLSHLRTHRRVHTGEKPYKCKECNYAAASSSRLKDHLTVHREEKPHVCKVPGCGRRYKRLSHLIFHHSKHAGVKPYVCNRCGMSFKLSSSLSLHKRQDICHLKREQQLEVNKAEYPYDAVQAEMETYDGVKSEPEMETYSILVEGPDVADPSVASHSIASQSIEDTEEGEAVTYIYHQEVPGEEVKAEMSEQHLQVLAEGETQMAVSAEEGQSGEYEQQIVIQILREPGQEDEDIVLSKEELERIVRLSQQMQ